MPPCLVVTERRLRCGCRCVESLFACSISGPSWQLQGGGVVLPVLSSTQAEQQYHACVMVTPCMHLRPVQMSDIGLLVFDEAHHCKSDHPYNQLMQVRTPQRQFASETMDSLVTHQPV